MKSKRGQGLPMNTIVIAAIVLVVLVVIIMIFTGGMGSFVGGLTKNCQADFGGTCGNFRCDVPTSIVKNSIPMTGTNCKGTKQGEIETDYCCTPPK